MCANFPSEVSLGASVGELNKRERSLILSEKKPFEDHVWTFLDQKLSTKKRIESQSADKPLE